MWTGGIECCRAVGDWNRAAAAKRIFAVLVIVASLVAVDWVD
jgi:hypothetical protein